MVKIEPYFHKSLIYFFLKFQFFFLKMYIFGKCTWDLVNMDFIAFDTWTLLPLNP
jgi:hypothetical protein